METKKVKNIFIDGPISSVRIADSIQQHNNIKEIGAHSIFLGQVRADAIDQKKVVAIEFFAYESMAAINMRQIRETIFEKYDLTCLHVYHSVGTVAVGEICLFVFASSAHRKEAMDACCEVVERIKVELPIWGKELFMDGSFQWKINKNTASIQII